MEGTLSTVTMFGSSFAPRAWACCAGQLLPVSSNSALFSLLGTNFGGDGRTTFGLPDLRARTPVGSSCMGDAPGAHANFGLGQLAGAQVHTLSVNEMPMHDHPAVFTPGPASPVEAPQLNALNVAATTADPTGNMHADASGSTKSFAPKGSETPVAMDPASITGGGSVTVSGTVSIENSGGGAAFSLLNPVQGLNYIICLAGIFPSRS